jgi:hypothetical protein
MLKNSSPAFLQISNEEVENLHTKYPFPGHRFCLENYASRTTPSGSNFSGHRPSESTFASAANRAAFQEPWNRPEIPESVNP